VNDRIVVDTNVFIAALGNPCGTASAVFDRVFSGTATFLYSDVTLSEYRHVIRYSQFRKRFTVADGDAVVDLLEDEGERAEIYTRLITPIPDEEDTCFAELVVEGRADVLITTDKGYPPWLGVPICTPKEWLTGVHKP